MSHAKPFIILLSCQPSIFAPLCGTFVKKTNTEKLERIHFRALKFIFQDFDATYENLIMREGTTTLHLSRLRGLALETFKIIHGNSLIYLNHFLTLKETCYNFRCTNLLNLPRVRSSRHGTNSFSFQAAKLWNALPEEARKITTFNVFKRFIKGWNGVSCKCNMCK